jgi:hypothetical protein
MLQVLQMMTAFWHISAHYADILPTTLSPDYCPGIAWADNRRSHVSVCSSTLLLATAASLRCPQSATALPIWSSSPADVVCTGEYWQLYAVNTVIIGTYEGVLWIGCIALWANRVSGFARRSVSRRTRRFGNWNCLQSSSYTASNWSDRARRKQTWLCCVAYPMVYVTQSTSDPECNCEISVAYRRI